MHDDIVKRLSVITAEEQSILDGRKSIDRDIYMQERKNVVHSGKLLSAGKMITIRPHTRFIDFPRHTHDYVEVVYMCTGSTVHIVNGKEIRLGQGELLFLSQSVTHEVYKAGLGDVAINFIVLPDFFANSLTIIGGEETPLRRFLVDCLCGQKREAAYLHFRVAEVMPIQNLIENLLWILLEDHSNKRKISQMTMSLLFLQLMGHTDTLVTEGTEDAAILKVLRYVETNYATANLSHLAELLHYDLCWLSREIKRKTGKTFTQLVQEKRLAQAIFLLRNTDRNVADISFAVGYENISYFHRIFAKSFGKTPKEYRDERKVQ